MGMKTEIAWTDYTWNTVTGCTPCSEACNWCYAEKLATRLKNMGNQKYRNGFEPTLHWGAMNDPRLLKDRQKIFVNSMSDTFHEAVPDDFIQTIFKTMRKCPQHIFQVLTKRSDRLADLGKSLTWGDNVWAGVTVEHPDYKYRIDDLRKVPAKIRFLSIEPLLADLGKIDLTDIHWVIIGGLSGVEAEILKTYYGDDPTMFDSWVEGIVNQCREQGVAIFYKQRYGFRPEKEPLFTTKGKKLLEYPV